MSIQWNKTSDGLPKEYTAVMFITPGIRTDNEYMYVTGTESVRVGSALPSLEYPFEDYEDAYSASEVSHWVEITLPRE
jgi:hypothetical protein